MHSGLEVELPIHKEWAGQQKGVGKPQKTHTRNLWGEGKQRLLPAPAESRTVLSF